MEAHESPQLPQAPPHILALADRIEAIFYVRREVIGGDLGKRGDRRMLTHMHDSAVVGLERAIAKAKPASSTRGPCESWWQFFCEHYSWERAVLVVVR